MQDRLGESDAEGKSASGRAIPTRDEGAFNAFPSIKETGMSRHQFEDRAMAEAGVALLSGAVFGEFGEGCGSLSYVQLPGQHQQNPWNGWTGSCVPPPESLRLNSRT